MKGSKTAENDRKGGQPVRCTPPIVLPGAWEAARQEMLVKEKGLMRARDALAAERRRMPWMAVEKAYEFEGPKGKVSLLDLFQGRRQLSMMLWRWTGDLLLYGWVQFFPGVALPLLFLVFPPRYSGTLRRVFTLIVLNRESKAFAPSVRTHRRREKSIVDRHPLASIRRRSLPRK